MGIFTTATASAILAFAALSSGSSAGNVVIDNNEHTKTIQVNQGDTIYMDSQFGQDYLCTLNSIFDDYAFSAGHCGGVGTVVRTYPGMDYIGTVVESDNSGNIDHLAIKLGDNVGGENIYSGDRISSIAEMEQGDTICQYGATTKKVQCSPMFGLPRLGALWSSAQSLHGDSGGPAWIEGKGLIGITSGKYGDMGTVFSELYQIASKYPLNTPIAAGTSDYMPSK